VSLKSTLNIAYVNVQGLNSLTYQHISNYLLTNTYDLLITSETWFLSSILYTNSPYFLGESSRPLQLPGRRYNGGMLALASPSIKAAVTVFHKSQYILGLAYNNIKFGFVYFPPSLSAEVIECELERLGNVDNLIGDFNIRLGSLSGDCTTTDSLRTHTIHSYTSTSHLSYTRNLNTDITTRTDHIYSNLNPKWSYVRTLPFATDHGLMDITINSPTRTYTTTNPRFDFKPLLNPMFKGEFVETFDSLYGEGLVHECNTALELTLHSMILPDTNETQTIIDETYKTLTTAILKVLTLSLESYDPQLVKTKRDSSLKDCSNPPTSVSAAISRFKRNQRNKALFNPVVSSNPLLSPLDDSLLHYTSLYTSDDIAPSIERQNDTIFGLRVTADLITQHILKYSNHKSMGPDGNHILVYKTLTKSSYFMHSLTTLFQLFATTGLVPSDWSTCRLHLLIKDPDNPIPANTRPIALSNILRRIFEKILMELWDSGKQDWMSLDNGQAGFRKGYSTVSQLVLSDELSRHQNNYCSIFLDLKAAFDSVCWSKLDQLLRQRNCPPSSRNLILSLMCRPATLNLSVNQSTAHSVFTKKGVFQGGGISAFIFAIYIDPLATLLNTNTPLYQPLGLLYADDIQLKPSSYAQAQQLLDTCTRYASEYSLTWNIKKCGIVGDPREALFISNQLIPIVDSYTYLGCKHLASRVDWQSTMDIAIAKQRVLLNVIDSNSWHPRMKLIVYRTFIRPITEYVMAPAWLWALRDKKRRVSLIVSMEKAHKTAVACIFRRTRHLKIMDYMSGLGSFTHRINSLLGGLEKSFRRLSISNPLIAARSVYCVSTSSHFILGHCFRSAYYRRYQSDTTRTLTTWKTWLQRQIDSQRLLAGNDSAMLAYYFPSTRMRDNSSLLFCQPSDTFYCCFSWRANLALPHRSCSCGSSFTRNHVGCLLCSDSSYQSSLLSAGLLKDLEYLGSSAGTYGVLDHLLNSQNYEMFLFLFSKLSTMLDPTPYSDEMSH